VTGDPDSRHQVVLAVPFALTVLLGLAAFGAGIYDVAVAQLHSGVSELVASGGLALGALYFFRKIREYEPLRRD